VWVTALSRISILLTPLLGSLQSCSWFPIIGHMTQLGLILFAAGRKQSLGITPAATKTTVASNGHKDIKTTRSPTSSSIKPTKKRWCQNLPVSLKLIGFSGEETHSPPPYKMSFATSHDWLHRFYPHYDLPNYTCAAHHSSFIPPIMARAPHALDEGSKFLLMTSFCAIQFSWPKFNMTVIRV